MRDVEDSGGRSKRPFELGEGREAGKITPLASFWFGCIH